MAKTIKTTIEGDGFIPLDVFRSFVDVDSVHYYRLKVNKDKTITLKFYDKNKRLIKLDKRN